ncbi:MAG TPA: hypothetical protein VIJ68_03370 [Candidatus Saccharimonadales bacterium]
MRKLGNLKTAALGLGTGLFLLTTAAASATSASISHSFKSSGPLKVGSLVSLDPQRNSYVQLANTSNAQRLIGIAVSPNGSLLAVNANAASTVPIATSGTTSALVSNLNGSIAVGDQIGVSPFDGVGMKAQAGSRFIGLARTAFSAKTAGATSEQISDKSGKRTSIVVGYVNVSIGIGTLPSVGSGDNLNALQGLAQSFTGHIVPTARIIFSLIVILVTVMALIPLIYGAIYSGIVSIGRNPLAKHEILRSLGVVLFISLLVLAVASVTVYLLLR